MRIKLAVISGAVVVLTVGTGAAYAAVGHNTVSPTVTGNSLPIDDNHSSKTGLEPGDDRGAQPTTGASRTVEPGDDRGASTAEPADDRNRARGSDDTTTGPSRNGGITGSGAGSPRATNGHGSDDSAAGPTMPAVATSASATASDDHGRGRDGAGHH